MNETERVRVEYIVDQLAEHGIQLGIGVASDLAEGLVSHLNMEREMEMYQHIGRVEKCQECQNKDLQIKDLEYQIKVYKTSVKSRRNAEHVWIENGEVRYE